MLKVSKLTDYSTVMLSYMARQPADTYSVADIASAVGVPPPTASKIMKNLARRQLVLSRRGLNGGYALSRSPSDITIAQVIEAMEGQFGLTECSVAKGLCASEDHCRIRRHWQRINQIVFQSLGAVTLADMSDDRFHLQGRSTALLE